jgi:hypothetical protein
MTFTPRPFRPFVATLAAALASVAPATGLDLDAVAWRPQAATVREQARPGDVVLPVSFHFAKQEEGHEILVTDVHVAIDDAATRGRVLSAVSDGPYLIANVPEGEYQVTATHDGNAQVAVIVVERGGSLRVAFRW